MSEPHHDPVMVREVVELLEPDRGGTFVDCTVGLGGHAEAILRAGPRARLVGIDRDPEALRHARERLGDELHRVDLVAGRFSEIAEIVTGLEAAPVAGVVADLGVSSMQLERASRGFSLQRDGPLDMRMGAEGTTAAEIVNHYGEDELERVFREYGEERMARRIARAITRARRDRPVGTTGELRRIVHEAKRRRREGRIDSATRVFQALRIEVNREIAELEGLLDEAVRLLDVDGRLVVISYHSLEDRPVKHRLRAMAEGEKDPITGRPRAETRLLELLTKKALRPSEEEVARNPRARSARLRAARRIETR